MSSVRVAVVGAGYWGPNLVRNFAACPKAELVAVCDRDLDRCRKVAGVYPGVETVGSIDDLLARDDVDAVSIATPVETHAPIAIAALKAGKHVLVEKPMAASVRAAEEMVQTARDASRILMVDHTFIYSSPVHMIKSLVDSGELGELYFIDSVRINLGLFQHDINVVWDLAPHDLSIMDHVVDRTAQSVAAFGSCHAGDTEIEDIAYLNLDCGGGLVANFHVNWLSPVKVRHMMIGGSKKSIVYNDLEPTEKIKVYDCGITVSEDVERRSGILVGYRTGDVWSPRIPHTEPLQTMVTHFAECCLDNRTPMTDGEAGLRVVRILESAERSIKAQGGRIVLNTGSR